MEFVNLKTSMANEMIFAIFLPILIILVYIFIPEYFSRKINAELHFEVSALGLVFSILTSILPIKIIYFGDFIEGSTLFLSITGSIYFVQVFSLEVLYLVLAYLGKISVVAEYLSIISLYLAIFTLIPFWNSSGNKILRWNKWAYAVLVLTLILFFIGSKFIPSF
jgi:Zn-dependent protease